MYRLLQHKSNWYLIKSSESDQFYKCLEDGEMEEFNECLVSPESVRFDWYFLDNENHEMIDHDWSHVE